jgi:hypothetical protein
MGGSFVAKPRALGALACSALVIGLLGGTLQGCGLDEVVGARAGVQPEASTPDRNDGAVDASGGGDDAAPAELKVVEVEVKRLFGKLGLTLRAKASNPDDAGGVSLPDEPLATDRDGVVRFATMLKEGTPFQVLVGTHPEKQRCAVEQPAPVVGASGARVIVDCSKARTCAELLERFAATPPAPMTGAWYIDPDDAGPLTPFEAHCDTTFDVNSGTGGPGGAPTFGMTLVLSTANGKTPKDGVAGVVMPGSNAYAPVNILRALAQRSKRVHIRTKDNDARWITSKADNEIIANVRLGRITHQGLGNLSRADQASRWYGPFATSQTLGFSERSLPWPSVYHTVNNNQGLHLTEDDGGFSMWALRDNANEPMEVYLAN